MNPTATRIIQVLSGLTALAAPLLTASLVLTLGRIFGHHFHEILGDRPLPSLTVAVLALAPRAPLFAIVVILLYVIGVFFVFRRAPSYDSASTRLLLLITLVWVLCFTVLGAATISLVMPLISATVGMQQP